MKRVLFACLLLSAAHAHAGDWWDSLWHNADQRGEQLLQRGNAAAAAQTFSDPRRKAYAELQAGKYADAARDFSAFNDGDANYNRGNALARTGRLEDAIKAYDAALARDPNDRDARHNRDLVAKALQKPPLQPQASSSGSSSSGNSENGGKRQASGQAQSKQSSRQGKANPSSSAQNHGGKPQQAGTGQGMNESQGKESRSNESSAGQKPGDGAQQSAQASEARLTGQSTNLQNAQAQNADDAAQARSDAAASLGKLRPGQTPAPAYTPPNEQQLAQDQWLRLIPDDPGGLLRRKFMIEHMIRQQGGQP